ncbi:enterotoxin [Paraclostridium sordellii]|uniref:enterotoxin n=1 Tax=Paraclostridium sordellii TaxID=1505 RepID=UPI0030D1498C
MENIIKLNLDDNGNIINKEFLNIDPKTIDYTKLTDGLYVAYRGTDWVFGNDGSLEVSSWVTENTPQAFSKSLTHTTSIREASSAGLTFGPSYVKLAITQAYDKTITDTVTKQVTLNMTTKPGTETFYKVYSTYLRFDVVRVSNGEETHSATTYEFAGVRATSVTVDAGQSATVDTNKLVIREDSCLMNPVDDSIWQIIDTTPELDILTTGRKGTDIFDLNKNMIFNSFNYMSPSCDRLNFIFKITEAGTYVFYVGNVVNLDLSTLNINARDQITRMEFRPADGVNNNYIMKYMEGGNYVLSLEAPSIASAHPFDLLIQKK